MALYLGIKRVSPNMITPISGVTPSGIKNITDTSLTDVSLYQYAKVSDGNLVAGNIKKGVSILGITGTLESGGGGGSGGSAKLLNLISRDKNFSLTADDLAGLTIIGTEAFWSCTGLTSITIPDSVQSIGKEAFYKCTGLTSITMGNGVTKIGEDAFRGCTGLTSVIIGDGVTRIDSFAFRGCTGLTSVTLGNN